MMGGRRSVAAVVATLACASSAFTLTNVSLNNCYPPPVAPTTSWLGPSRIATCRSVPARRRQLFSGSADEISPSETSDQSALDQILAKLTSMFPLFVLGSAILGSCQPRTLQWVNAGQIISLMLGAVMLATGMSLQKADFTNILTDRTQRKSIPIGVMCQFMLMPLSASLVGRTFLLPYCDPNTAENLGKHLFLGLVLVGCSPGGTASNLVSLIAGADVALSVLLTAASTILASAVTPLLTKLIVGSAVPVSGMSLCVACAKVVLAPVALGVLMNETTPKVCRWVSRFTPFASVVLVSLICGGVVANNASMWTGSSMSLPVLILLSVIMTHLIGFAAGYLVPKRLFDFSEKTSRTISIETGMQNSALAVVLAKSIGADPLSYLPGALSATAHSCIGSALAAFWRQADSKRGKEEIS